MKTDLEVLEETYFYSTRAARTAPYSLSTPHTTAHQGRYCEFFNTRLA